MTPVFINATRLKGCQSQKQEVWHQKQTVAIEVKQYLLSFLCTMIPGFKPEITELNSRSLPLADRQGGCLYMEGVTGFSWLCSRLLQGGETRAMSCPLQAAVLLSTVARNHWPSQKHPPPPSSVALNTPVAGSFLIRGHLPQTPACWAWRTARQALRSCKQLELRGFKPSGQQHLCAVHSCRRLDSVQVRN